MWPPNRARNLRENVPTRNWQVTRNIQNSIGDRAAICPLWSLLNFTWHSFSFATVRKIKLTDSRALVSRRIWFFFACFENDNLLRVPFHGQTTNFLLQRRKCQRYLRGWTFFKQKQKGREKTNHVWTYSPFNKSRRSDWKFINASWHAKLHFLFSFLMEKSI